MYVYVRLPKLINVSSMFMDVYMCNVRTCILRVCTYIYVYLRVSTCIYVYLQNSS